MGLTSDNISTTASDLLQVGTGPYLTKVHVIPIFWGTAWADANNPSPTWLDVFTAISSIVTGIFMDGLNQYAGIQRGGIIIRDGTRYPFDPPNNPFKDSDTHTLLTNLIKAGLLPDPSVDQVDQFLYVVFIPPGFSRTPPGLGGDHTFFSYNGVQAYAIWVGHGDLDGITDAFSHELAEACSDANGGSGITIDNSEIADWCGAYSAKLDGVMVQAYWSKNDNACIIPTLQLTPIGRMWPVGTVELSNAGLGTGGLAVARNQNGTLEVFGRAQADGSIWHIRQNPAPAFGFTYSGWSSLGGDTLLASHCAIANSDGRIEVFAVGTNGTVFHIWQNQTNASPSQWSAWNSLGVLAPGVAGGPPVTVIGTPCVARNANGLLEVFACGSDHALWHITQTGALDWGNAWHSLGGQILAGLFVIPVICVGTNVDGRLEVFVRGMDTDAWHNWQNRPNAGPNGWSGWNSLGKTPLISQLAVGRNANGSLELFAIGQDSALWHISQTDALDWGGVWNTLHGSCLGLITVGSNQDGRLEVLVRGTDNLPYHISQNTPNASPANWNAFVGGDLQISALNVVSNVDGRLEVFVIGLSDGYLHHMWQTTPNGNWNW